MVGVVIVSHSAKAAEGIREIAAQMSQAGQKILVAGGTQDGGIGTDAMKIAEAIREADDGDGVAVMVDLGSAIFSTETALEFLEEALLPRVQIVDAPVLEGTVSAVVQASLGGKLDEVVASAEEARDLRKK